MLTTHRRRQRNRLPNGEIIRPAGSKQRHQHPMEHSIPHAPEKWFGKLSSTCATAYSATIPQPWLKLLTQTTRRAWPKGGIHPIGSAGTRVIILRGPISIIIPSWDWMRTVYRKEQNIILFVTTYCCHPSCHPVPSLSANWMMSK